jgi:HSP20 family protein
MPNFHDGVLTISGEVHHESADENDRVLVRERSYGKFSRRINLPATVDADKIVAGYDSGVLTLEIPQAESAKPRQIEIKQQKLLK